MKKKAKAKAGRQRNATEQVTGRFETPPCFDFQDETPRRKDEAGIQLLGAVDVDAASLAWLASITFPPQLADLSAPTLLSLQ